MNQATRLQAHHTAQMSLPLSFDLSTSPRVVTAISAPSRGIQDEDRYLCAWLRSRLEDGLWLLREESALTATEQQRRQVTRLAHKARSLGLPVWPQRHGKAVA